MCLCIGHSLQSLLCLLFAGSLSRRTEITHQQPPEVEDKDGDVASGNLDDDDKDELDEDAASGNSNDDDEDDDEFDEDAAADDDEDEDNDDRDEDEEIGEGAHGVCSRSHQQQQC